MKIIAGVVLLLSLIFTPHVWGITDYFIPIEAGSSARSARLAHITGFSAGSDSVFDNPASLDRVNQFSGNLFSTTFMGEVGYQNLTAAMRLPDDIGGVVGFGYMSVGVTGLLSTDVLWNPDVVNRNLEDEANYTIIATGETFGYSNQLFKTTYQFNQNENISWGLGFTYYMTAIDEVTGSGFNMDVGGLFNFYPFIFSVSARNVIPGLGVSYSNGGKENLPLQTIYGVLYEWQDFNFMGQVKVSDGLNKQLLKSGAVNYRPDFFYFLQLSLGYREMAVVKDVKTSITAGATVAFEGVNFDYAYETSDNVLYNAKHYFSLGFSF